MGEETPRNFALTGAAGFVASRHFKAIHDTGNRLVAAVDPHDAVGVLDRYALDVRFFTEIERFDRHLDKLRRGPERERVHFVSVCSPNYLHDAHIRLALRAGAHVICEKPLVINPWNLDGLHALERETGRRVYTVLQLRLHPQLMALRDTLATAPASGLHDVCLTYVTARGNWYDVSWKGSDERSGGIATNIGIHLFDLLIWMFGAVVTCEVHVRDRRRMAGYVQLERARVRWLLSTDIADLPAAQAPSAKTTFRSITVDGREVEFSDGFTDLHTRVYEEALAGRGFGIEDSRPSIRTVVPDPASAGQPDRIAGTPRGGGVIQSPPASAAASRWTVRPLSRVDLYIVVTLFVMMWVVARMYLPAFRASGGEALFYQEEYGPAVMAACGRGFVNPAPQSAPALDAFLHKRSADFDCGQLPESVAILPFDALQGVTQYLIRAAGAVWRIAGVSWPALDTLAAAMFAVSLATAYLTLRFLAGRAWALVGTLLWAASPMHLANLAHLRDYSKAPFFVLTGVAMGLAIRERRPGWLIAIGGAFGLVQGVGLGMRTDVTLNFVPFFIALFALASGGIARNLSGKFAAAVLAVAVFVAVAWPVLKVYGQAEGLWHVSLLGLTTPFDQNLNVHGAPYDFGYLYDDSYMSTVVQGYWTRVHGAAPGGLHESLLYDRACREYYQLLASTFPGDFLSRMAGSALHVLNLPFTIVYGLFPTGVTNTILVSLLTWRTQAVLALIGAGPLVAACLLVLIAMRRPWDACVAFVVLLFWTTFPFLQFGLRHVFHLEMLVIAVVMATVLLAWRTVSDTIRGGSWVETIRRASKSAVLVSALFACIVAAIAAGRGLQASRVRALFDEYAGAPTEPVSTSLERVDDLRVRLVPAVFEAAGFPARFEQGMLVLMFRPHACAHSRVGLNVRYEAYGTAGSALDFSRELTVPVASGAAMPTRVFLPVYSVPLGEGVYRFSGVELPAADAACASISRARQIERLPLLLDVTLLPGWDSESPHQRIYLGPILPERLWLKVAQWWPGVAALG